MKRSQVLERAFWCQNKWIEYKLGRGGMKPEALFPWETTHKYLDCSGYVSWCLGISRKQGNTWIETTRIVKDAQSLGGFFSETKTPRPGDLIVYGDYGTRQGHVGILCESNAVIHCSSGNFRRYGDAIQVSSDLLWKVHGGVYAQCSFTEED